ncbi:MAG: Smr/MutS family protein [Flavobacteriales bacterium]|nr:Smr/MutS family protein [Flavobacteriales bacterium]
MYPEDIEIKIGFDQMRILLNSKCLGDLSRKRVEKMKPLSNIKTLRTYLSQTGEFFKILNEDDPFPSENYHDLQPVLNKFKIDGLSLELWELHQILQTILLIDDIRKYFKTREEKYPELSRIHSNGSNTSELKKILTPVLNEDGTLNDQASPELRKLTTAIAREEQNLHHKLVSIFKNAKKEGWTADTDIGIKNGRFVIPILADHKRKLKGLIHDESAGGNIIYLEPQELVEANNNLRHLQFEKQREIEKILKNTTLKIKPFKEDLETWSDTIGLTDFIRSKAMLGLTLNGSIPFLNQNKQLKLVDALNPQLVLLHKKNKEKLIPLNLELNEQKRIMVISGPNAGGKSVALKTVLLNQYMLQCGLMPCCSAESNFCLFKDFMADIGDGQSIDQSLSSYSAHLTAMNYFVNHSGPDSLFIIDELGSGTDPKFGGAIGEAVLYKLNQNKGFGLVSTHFSNLKTFAEQNEGFENGSMLYDVKNYKPLYQLRSGKPGSSYAIELAIKTGLNKSIIELAKQKIGSADFRLEELVNKYDRSLKQTEELQKRLTNKEQQLDNLLKEYKELSENLNTRKKTILGQSKKEALQILADANKLVERTIREIKQSGAESVKTKNLKNNLKEEKQKIEIELAGENISKNKKDIKPEFKEGDLVKISGHDSPGIVLQVGKERLLIEMGLIKTRVPFDQVEIVKNKKLQIKNKIQGFNYNEISRDFSPRLDVRGLAAEEAVHEVMKRIDQALVLSIDKLWILHGKGNGILRKLIRDQIKGIPHVIQIESEHPDFGGDGITIIGLK